METVELSTLFLKLTNVIKDKILAKVRDCFRRYTGCWLVNMLHVKVC